MSVLFRRDYRLVVGSFDLSLLDFEFQVKRTLKPEPNQANIKIYNLAETTRHAFEIVGGKGDKAGTGIPVRLEAGYVGNRSLIYLGEVRNAQSTSNGPDIVTEMSSGDGERALQTSRISVPVGPKSPPDVALRLIARAIGVDDGNLALAAQKLVAKGTTTLHPKGTAYYGSARQALDDFTHSAGLEWSVQDGALQILDKDAALAGQAILLSPTTGLVGSPSVDNKGILSAKCLIQPDLRPGIKIKMDAVHVQGLYRIIETDFQGETLGQNWYCDLRAEVLSG